MAGSLSQWLATGKFQGNVARNVRRKRFSLFLRAQTALAAKEGTASHQSITKEVRWQRVIVHNGIAIYATWTTVASVNTNTENPLEITNRIFLFLAAPQSKHCPSIRRTLQCGNHQHCVRFSFAGHHHRLVLH